MKRPDNPVPEEREDRKDFQEQINAKLARKLRARQEGNRSIWFGLGMFGMVGWSVAIPTLIGLAIGIWIDTHYPSPYSWTLMLLFIGVVLGSLNAWYWVQQERTEE
jgi:ATP synthase protein I